LVIDCDKHDFHEIDLLKKPKFSRFRGSKSKRFTHYIFLSF